MIRTMYLGVLFVMIVLVFAAVVIGLIRKTDQQMKAEYALSAN